MVRFGPLTSPGFPRTAFLELRSRRTLPFPSTFDFSSSFFLFAQEKGPKRTAPACRARLGAGRPLGAEPVFPRITPVTVTFTTALRTRRHAPGNGAKRNSAEKPPSPPPIAPWENCTTGRENCAAASPPPSGRDENPRSRETFAAAVGFVGQLSKLPTQWRGYR